MLRSRVRDCRGDAHRVLLAVALVLVVARCALASVGTCTVLDIHRIGEAWKTTQGVLITKSFPV